MALSFHTLSLDDRDLILKYTRNADLQNCDLAFANLYAWQFLYQTEVTEWNGFLLFRFYADGHLAYLMPLGQGNWREVIELMHQDACLLGHPLLILGVTEEMKHYIQGICSSKFVINPNREYADYIYLRENLATLAGKKLQPKRNHTNKFRRLYPDYEYRPLTRELIPLCLQLDEEWAALKTVPGEQRAVESEKKAIRRALEHFEELGIIGGTLFVDGKLVAFTYGAPINDSTFDVCVEKADTTYEGAYAMINQEFVNHLPEQYRYINREEDLGIEGLRKAKLSYMPHQVLMKYSMWSSCSLQGKCACEMRSDDELHVEWQTRALWKLCFGDSDLFLDLFFSKKYKPQNNSFIRKDGKVVSALQRLPYRMSYAGLDVAVAYVAGASTLPEQRGRGLMTQLLAEAHERMYQEGKVFSLLIPANEGLVDFYARSGYVCCSGVENTEDRHSVSSLSVSCEDPVQISDELREEMADFMEQAYRRMPAAVLHDADDLQVILQDLSDSGGRVWMARGESNNRLCGVLLVLPQDKGWLVKECLATDRTVAARMKETAQKELCPEKELAEETYCTQIKVIRVSDALKLYARVHPEADFTLEVTGDSLSGNAAPATYLIRGGQCTRLETCGPADCRYTVEELPRLLFAQGGPYMRLMLN